MALRMAHKVALVTASTEGIGLSIARSLCKEGADVMISSRKEANVNKALEAMKSEKMPGQVHGLVCHVGKQADRKKLIEETVSKFGKIDALVSCAGTNPHFGPILDISEEVWDKMFDTNVKSAFFLTKEAVPHMTKDSSIVYVSSVAGYHPIPFIGAYSVSKTTLLGLVKALSSELASTGIRVNGIAPGIINTKFSTSLINNPALAEKSLENFHIKRFGETEECAGAVTFLCSKEASYITGEIICITGGFHARL